LTEVTTCTPGARRVGASLGTHLGRRTSMRPEMPPSIWPRLARVSQRCEIREVWLCTPEELTYALAELLKPSWAATLSPAEGGAQ
jgi:hypothetical protein